MTIFRCGISRMYCVLISAIMFMVPFLQEMAEANGAVPDVAENQGHRGAWTTFKNLFSRVLLIYLMVTMFKIYTKDADRDVTVNARRDVRFRNLFVPGQLFDLHLYLDISEQRFTNFVGRDLFYKGVGMRYGDYSNDLETLFEKTIPTPEVLMQNKSIYLHVFITKSGFSPNPHDHSYEKREVIYGVTRLNKFRRKHHKQTINLLTGMNEQSETDVEKSCRIKYEVLNFWHPNLTISLVDDQTQWNRGALPPPFNEAIVFDTVGGFYLPILFFNDYWNLAHEYVPVNSSMKEITLRISYQSLSLFKYQLYASQQTRNKWSLMLGNEPDDDDQDLIKQALLETNPIVLGATFFVSILHTVFEFLAFKNDIQFWHARNNLKGLSVRSVLFNIFQSLVVFLFICDNDTNWIVKTSVGVGFLIECWKLPKVVNFQIAFKYLFWILFPLFAGYAIYSLVFVEQRGWYSWILNMLYGFLLMFGFIMMTPQLFINYKLKSVAHLPWRMLTYKFINTFIDDLFAFVIRMPIMYRIGCFRDDIVFIIYLYQRWIYRVDPKRMNEFGSFLEPAVGSEEMLQEHELKKE
uniref:Cleft lip and palate associated transmembrane protein 1 n=1 Tax=Haemonchus contortus TaxID=6289 RepID=A0A7I5EDZ4_HAECO